jgi:hypothetical protein
MLYDRPDGTKEEPQDPEMREVKRRLDIAKRGLGCLAGGEFETVERTVEWAQGVLDDINGGAQSEAAEALRRFNNDQSEVPMGRVAS